MVNSTDTFVSQEAATLSRAKWLLRSLTYQYESGTVSDGRVVRCIYCLWQNEDYEAEPQHEAECPIKQVREFLWDGDTPYPLERGA